MTETLMFLARLGAAIAGAAIGWYYEAPRPSVCRPDLGRDRWHNHRQLRNGVRPMSGKKIIKGLKQAVAHAKGDRSKARVHKVRVPATERALVAERALVEDIRRRLGEALDALEAVCLDAEHAGLMIAFTTMNGPAGLAFVGRTVAKRL